MDAAMRAKILLVAVTLMMLIAGLVLGSSAAQAQSDGEWVRGAAQIAESATQGGIERISVSSSSISVEMTGPLGSNALARYDIKWNEPPTVLQPGEKFTVNASMAAYMVSEGVAQSYSEEAFVMRGSGGELLRLLASQGCGGTGSIVCSEPVSLPTRGEIVAPLSGQTFVVEALSGKCSCKVTWSYEWQQAAVVAPPPPLPTTTTVAPTTVAPAPTTVAPAAPTPTTAVPTPATQQNAAAVPESSTTRTSEPSVAAAPGSETAPSTTPPGGDGPSATAATAPDSQPGTAQTAVPVSSASGEPLITDEEAIAASIAGVFIALIISGLTLAEAGLRLTDLFGESGRELADSFGAFDADPVAAAPTSAPPQASPGAQDGAEAPWYQGGTGASTQVPPEPAPWYQEPAQDSGGPAAPVSDSSIEDDVVDWLEAAPLPQSDGPAPHIPVGPLSRAVDTDFDGVYDEMEVDTDGDGIFDQTTPLTDAQRAGLYEGAIGQDGVTEPAPAPAPAPDHASASASAPDPVPAAGFEDDVMGLLDDAALGGQAPPITSPDGLMGGGPAVRITDSDNDGIYDRVAYDTDGDGEFGLDERRGLGAETPAEQAPTATDPDETVQVETSEELEAEVADGAPVDPDWVSRQEIDDIYERGLASGRSLDDLREDVAGLSQARGGPAEVPDPYGFQMSATEVGPVPLTSGEVDDYRAAQQELQRYMAERDRLHQEWNDYLSERQEWRGRSRIRAALEVWNAESRFVEQEQLNIEWRYTWNEWLRGNRFHVAPDGSAYNESFLHVNDPYFEGDPSQSATAEIARLQRVGDNIDSSRVRYMEAARDRPSAAEDGARLDEVQQGIIDRNRIISGPINAARERINRVHSYGNGRPLPD
jgi:hypothetical protein